jgi:hypothetical protein
MKRSLIISAVAIGAYYLVRQFMGRSQEEMDTMSAPRQKHITNAFSKAKEHAVGTL